CRFGNPGRDLDSQFAWMGPNLFQGPSGTFRTDDPGSEREPLKPLSFPQELWDNLTKVEGKLRKLAKLTSGNGYRASVSRAVTVGDLEDVLDLLAPIAAVGHGNAHALCGGDWLLMKAKDSAPQEYKAMCRADVRITAQNNSFFTDFEKTTPAK